MFDLSLFINGALLMLIGQLAHEITKVQKYIRDENKPDFSIKDYLHRNRWLIPLDSALIIVTSLANGFIQMVSADTASVWFLMSGFAIDASAKSFWGQNVEKLTNKPTV